uniref:ADP-ribosylation factor-like protein 14 n=1 Tax=Nothobranchius furzeri TaxID=105023 RepID=A0A1A8AD97_NOTFU
MLGLDGSGKTSLLYKLKYNENVVTVPTAGFTVESLEIDGKSPELTVWDVGGQRKMRPHWRHYYYETAGLMFAVDSQNERRLDEARKELHRVLRQDSLRGVPLVVLANKQALPDALSPQSLSVKLDLRGGCGGPGVVRPALLSQHWDGTGRRFHEDGLSDEDPFQTDSGRH